MSRICSRQFLSLAGIALRSYLRLMLLWDALDMNNFYFLFLLFSDFIRILFSFSFLFFWMMKRHVTRKSHDMSHVVTS